jgi:hypothetical protein
MPVVLRASLYFFAGVVGFVWLMYRLKRTKPQVGIDEEGAFLFEHGRYIRLSFVRVNSIQLIAMQDHKSMLLRLFWPRFYVIFCDSVAGEQYRFLRSFAAQQILLRRSEEAKEHFEK